MFKVKELVAATNGRLLQGDAEQRIGGISIDSRSLKPGQAFLALKGNNFDGHNFIGPAVKKKAVCIVLEESRALKNGALPVIKVKDTVKALGNIAGYQRRKFSKPVIAITGSNGKTTTKEMISFVLSGEYKVLKNEGTKNNHIGLPQALAKLNQDYDFGVFEIGSNHFGEVDYLAKICQPNIGVFTNIGQSHLEFFKDLKGVLKEKSSLLNNLIQPRIAILNADDHLLAGLIRRNKGKRIIFSYGINQEAEFKASDIRLEERGVYFRVNRKHPFCLNTCGRHNIYNALCAIALGRLFGMSYSVISDRLEDFVFPKGRLNLITLNRLKIIDDTYNSNPFSLEAALAALAAYKIKGRKVFVMGDMLELGRQKELLHKEIAGSITNICNLFVAVGGLAKLTARALKCQGFNRKGIFSCATSIEARKLLFNKLDLGPDDIILVKGSRSMHMEEAFRI